VTATKYDGYTLRQLYSETAKQCDSYTFYRYTF